MKFFRTLRQRFLTGNRSSKYLGWATGEIVLTMIGILLALQVNDRNQSARKTLHQSEVLAGTGKLNP